MDLVAPVLFLHMSHDHPNPGAPPPVGARDLEEALHCSSAATAVSRGTSNASASFMNAPRGLGWSGLLRRQPGPTDANLPDWLMTAPEKHLLQRMDVECNFATGIHLDPVVQTGIPRIFSMAG